MTDSSIRPEVCDESREMAVGLQVFASLANHVGTAVVVASPNQTILVANQAFCDLFFPGAVPAEIEGVNGPDAADRAKYLVRDWATFPVRIAEILEASVPVAAEEIVFADGRVFERDYIPTRLDGRLLAHVWQYRDVTERVLSDGRHRSLVANIPDVAWSGDATGRAVFISPNIEKVYGFSQQEIYEEGERLWFGRIHPDDLDRVKRSYDRLFSHGERFDVEYRIQRKDGEWIWFHDRADGTHVHDGLRVADGLLSDVTERRRADEALRASEARFAVAFNAMPYASAIATMADGCFVDVNEAFTDMLGYTREEVIGVSSPAIGIWAHTEDRRYVVKRVAADGCVRNLQIEVRTKTGELLTVLLSAEAIEIAGERCLLSVTVDITERIRVERELLKRDAQLRHLIDANPIGIFFSDFSGAVTEANDACLRTVGYTRDELRAGMLDWKAMTPPEYSDASDDADEQAKAYGFYQPYEKEYIRKDGTRVPVLVGGVIFEGERESGYGIDFVLDLTGQKRAEAALRASEERYRTMFESDLTGNYISTPDGELLACNEAFARIYGFGSVEETLKHHANTFYALPEDRETFLVRLRSERRLARYECELRRRDGTTLHTIDFVEGVFDGTGELVEIHGSCYDDTVRKALEDQLRQSQKMEAIGRLAGGVAHDFNNLLTVIGGYSELMLALLSPSDPLRASAQEIRDAAERAAGLTRQLLAFSRKQILQPRRVSLNELVANLERMLRRLIGEDIELATELAGDLPSVVADPGQLEQVVANLVVNARDAMPHGGRLTIATSTAAPPWSTEPGECVALTVADTGCGMDEQTRSHIFEPFFTTKPAGHGTGLGLATVYGIVQQSRGSIEVQTEPGCGTTFHIYIPASAATAEPAQARSAAEPKRRGAETILLVEDEDSVRKLAATALRQYGYKVLEARGGGEALLIAESHGGPISLVVSDVVMPQMNGRELVERVQSTRPETKVLYMSGYTEDDVLRRGVSEERAAFLAKPFGPDDLARKVREVLDSERP